MNQVPYLLEKSKLIKQIVSIKKPSCLHLCIVGIIFCMFLALPISSQSDACANAVVYLGCRNFVLASQK